MTPPDVASATLRKVTLRLIPFLFLLYIVAWLDRVNVGFAALQMNSNLGFSSAAFGFGSGVFFLGYCLCEVPSNLMLHRVGARRWIARIMISWGAISVAMMFVRSASAFYALRFLLGAAEAGFFPGVVYYLSHWYPEAQRARAIAAFMTAVPVSGVIGGPLSGALLNLNGVFGLAGWQWLFLVEGVPAILLGAIVFAYLTDRPETAHWLSSAEKDWLTSRLAAEHGSRGAAHSVVSALTNPTIWTLGIIFLLAAVGFYGYSFWAPLVFKSLTGASDLGVGIVIGLISAVTIILMLLNSMRSDRTDERRIFWLRSFAATHFGAGLSGDGPDRALRGLWTVLVPAIAVPHGSACSCGNRFSGDNRKRGRLHWSYDHRRNEGPLRNAWSRIHFAGWMRNRRGAARDRPSTNSDPTLVRRPVI